MYLLCDADVARKSVWDIRDRLSEGQGLAENEKERQDLEKQLRREQNRYIARIQEIRKLRANATSGSSEERSTKGFEKGRPSVADDRRRRSSDGWEDEAKKALDMHMSSEVMRINMKSFNGGTALKMERKLDLLDRMGRAINERSDDLPENPFPDHPGLEELDDGSTTSHLKRPFTTNGYRGSTASSEARRGSSTEDGAPLKPPHSLVSRRASSTESQSSAMKKRGSTTEVFSTGSSEARRGSATEPGTHSKPRPGSLGSRRASSTEDWQKDGPSQGPPMIARSSITEGSSRTQPAKAMGSRRDSSTEANRNGSTAA